ncbi:hypothetical protein F2Q68_00016760 [Brassica cretica]|uniref:Uncharacterized protein n=1 Tax=Brassica cretica TaxID=69181 RepID=A0A8S9HFB6_BRACR|nr:hypothetical protein F2Q68_00016760 [Brassica cretica]
MAVGEQDELPKATQREAELQRQIGDLQGQVTGLRRTQEETNPELSSEFQILKEKLNEHSKQLEQSTEKLSQLESKNPTLRDENQALNTVSNKKPRFRTQILPMPTLETPNSGTAGLVCQIKQPLKPLVVSLGHPKPFVSLNDPSVLNPHGSSPYHQIRLSVHSLGFFNCYLCLQERPAPRRRPLQGADQIPVQDHGRRLISSLDAGKLGGRRRQQRQSATKARSQDSQTRLNRARRETLSKTR